MAGFGTGPGRPFPPPMPAKPFSTQPAFWAGCCAPGGWCLANSRPLGWLRWQASPREGLWAAALGAFLGYLLPSPAAVPVRYAAAILAVTAIRWSLSELKGLNNHALFAPIVTFLPLLLTGMTLVLLNGSLNYTAALYVAESFLGGRVRLLPAAGRQPAAGPHRRTASAAPALCTTAGTWRRWWPLWGVVALSFSGITFGGVSLGRMLLVLLVLHLRPAGRRGRRHRSRGGRWGDSGAFHGGALLPLRGLWPWGGLMAGGVLPHGQAGHGRWPLSSPTGWPPCRWGRALRRRFCGGAIEVGAGHHPVHGAAQKPTAGPAVRRAQGHPQRRGPAGEHCAAAAPRGGGPRPGAHLGGGDFPRSSPPSARPTSRGCTTARWRPSAPGAAGPGGLLRKHKEETLANFGQLTKTLREKGRVDTVDFTKAFLRALRGGAREDAGRNQQELWPVPA